jgi:hypothetical protein
MRAPPRIRKAEFSIPKPESTRPLEPDAFERESERRRMSAKRALPLPSART